MTPPDLLIDISDARLADLTLRKAANTLTTAERLALNVLAGGRIGEESADKLIDAAMEEFGTGGYRVPVRAVGNSRRMKVFITPAIGYDLAAEQKQRFAQALSAGLEDGKPMVAILPPGCSVQVYEVNEGAEVEVEVK